MKIEKINIGKEIEKIANKQGLAPTKIAKEWGKSRQNVYDLYKRETIDVNTLLEISKIFSFNFFEIYTKQLPFYLQNEDVNNEPIEATLQIKLRKDKKDQVLKLVFGDNNLEILNK